METARYTLFSHQIYTKLLNYVEITWKATIPNRLQHTSLGGEQLRKTTEEMAQNHNWPHGLIYNGIVMKIKDPVIKVMNTKIISYYFL